MSVFIEKDFFEINNDSNGYFDYDDINKVIMIITTKIIAIIILLYCRRQFAAEYCFVF